MKGLGKDFNVVGFASGIHIDLANASGVTFVVYESGGATTIDIKESKAGASETALAVVTELFTSNGTGGVHTRDTDDANGALGTGDSAIVKKDGATQNVAVFYIGASELSDLFDSVEVTINGSATCTAIVHGLLIQRAPQNLAISGTS